MCMGAMRSVVERRRRGATHVRLSSPHSETHLPVSGEIGSLGPVRRMGGLRALADVLLRMSLYEAVRVGCVAQRSRARGRALARAAACTGS